MKGDETIVERAGLPAIARRYQGIVGCGRFVQKLWVKNKQKKQVRLRLHDEQVVILRHLVNDHDVLVLKARQIGNTTICLAYLFWVWYTSEDPVHIVILSHKAGASKKLLREMWKNFYRKLPPEMKRDLEVNNTTEMVLADTGATVTAEGAMAEGGVRSSSATHMIITEFAFIPNAAELKAEAVSALNDGQLIIESTANYYGDALHDEILAYNDGNSDFDAYLFFPWFTHKGYRLEVPPDWAPEPNTKTMLLKHEEISAEQACWYERQVRKLGSLDKTRREYPSTLEEAYSQTGDKFFSAGDLAYLETIEVDWAEEELCLLHDSIRAEDGTLQPDRDDAYAIGADVGSGSGSGDPSVLYVVSRRLMEPVAFWYSKTARPTAFAHKLHEVQALFSYRADYTDETVPALLAVESNNWGLPVLNELSHLGAENLYRDPERRHLPPESQHWVTSQKSKLRLFEDLRSAVREGLFCHLDKMVAAELAVLVDRGVLPPSTPNNPQHHGDRAIALGLARQAIALVELPPASRERPWYIRKRKLMRKLSELASPRRY